MDMLDKGELKLDLALGNSFDFGLFLTLDAIRSCLNGDRITEAYEIHKRAHLLDPSNKTLRRMLLKIRSSEETMQMHLRNQRKEEE